MATPSEVPLANLFTGGLNRVVAPQELNPDSSPDTTDARIFNRTVGSLGPRLGRTRIATKSNNYLGLGLLTCPFGRFTISCTDDGTWIQEALAWAGVTPATPTTPSVTGMDGSATCRTLQFKNRTIVFNGRNRPRVADGNKWTNLGILGGIDYPQWTPSITLGAAPAAATKYITTAARTGGTATITTATIHGFAVGQSVVVATAGDASYNGTWVIASTPTTTSFTYALSGTVALATVGGTAVAAVALKTKILTVTSNVATVTTWVAHGFIVGQTVTFINAIYPAFVSGSPYTITGVTSTTFTFAFTASNGTFYDLSATSPPQSGMDVYTGTIGSPGSSGITGTYYYMVAAANSTKLDSTGRNVEGIPSAVSAVAAPVGQAVTIGNIPASFVDPTTGDSQVDKWNIYRTTNGGFDTTLVPDQQDFFLLATVNVGTTSYVDTISDATGWYESPSTINRLRFNQNIPPTFKYGAVYGDRVFGAGFDPITSALVNVSNGSATVTLVGATWPDGIKGCTFRRSGEDTTYEIVARPTSTTITLSSVYGGTGATGVAYTIYRNPWEIWFSEYLSPDAWGPDGEGKRNKEALPGHAVVTGLMTFGGHLLVFTATEIYVITGQGPNRFDVKMVPDPAYSGLGAVSHDAIMRVDNEVHFLSLDGPAMISAIGSAVYFAPKLYGTQLNTDWLDSLLATELSLATCGTDGRSCWYSVPSAVGQTMNSKTYRFERDTKSWWEETGCCPRKFVRQDYGTQYSILFYLQNKSIIQPSLGTTDLVAAVAATVPAMTLTGAIVLSNVCKFVTSAPHNLQDGDVVQVVASDSAYSGTFTVVDGHSDTGSFTVSLTHANASPTLTGTVTRTNDRASMIIYGAGFPTTSGGLVECVARFYDATGKFIAAVRIISNTSSTFTWSETSTLPLNDSTRTLQNAIQGNGAFTIEIASVSWLWLSKAHDAIDPLRKTRPHLHHSDELYVTFASKNTNAILLKTNVIDGVEQSNAPETMIADEFTKKFDVASAAYEYQARVGSRTGAVIKHLSVRGSLEAENV